MSYFYTPYRKELLADNAKGMSFMSPRELDVRRFLSKFLFIQEKGQWNPIADLILQTENGTSFKMLIDTLTGKSLISKI